MKIFAIVLTVVLVAILVSQIDIQSVSEVVSNIEPLYLFIGFFLYLCTYFFRALRFRTLISSKKPNLRDFFAIVSIHNLANSILPARTGELSYIYLMKKFHDVPLGEGIATLIIARIFDGIAILTILFLSTSILGSRMHWSIMLSAIFLLISILFLLVTIAYYGEKAVALLERLIKKRGRVSMFLIEKGHEVVNSFENIRSGHLFLILFLISMTIWFFFYLMIYALLEGMRIHIGVCETVLASSLMIVVSVLPIQGIGGFGTIEATWTIAFMTLGFPKKLSITSAFAFHFIVMFYYTVTGCYGLIAMSRWEKGIKIKKKDLFFLKEIEKERESSNIKKYTTKNILKKGVIADFLSSVLSRIEKENPSRILDVGGGEGVVARLVEEKLGISVDVVDISFESLKVARTHGNKICGTIYGLPFRDSSYDFVLCLEVIEHLEDPEDALKEIQRLSPRAIISVPNSFLFRLGNLLSLKNVRNFGEDPDHRISFNAEKFENLLRKEFKEVKVIKKGFWLIGEVKSEGISWRK
ncbi:MAG: flippase-like domain-containing protein [Candidatus Syntropharchaeia archaeon]